MESVGAALLSAYWPKLVLICSYALWTSAARYDDDDRKVVGSSCCSRKKSMRRGRTEWYEAMYNGSTAPVSYTTYSFFSPVCGSSWYTESKPNRRIAAASSE